MPNKKPKFLPSEFVVAHDLCYMNHDIILEMLRSGERSKIFRHTIEIQSVAERQAIEELDDILVWLAKSGRTQDQASLLRKIIFPALVSDFLQFIYQALACSGQGHLVVTCALLRKPLQESLHLIELMVTELDDVASKLTKEPHKLAQGSTGGLDNHRKRIEAAISKINESERFDASYMVALRYDKSYEEGFGQLFDPAIHLFTSKESIRTEPMNINFIFSGPAEKWTQQAFIYSRLPYIITYARLLLENLMSNFIPTDPEYLEDIERRVSASILLWSDTIPDGYHDKHISHFIDVTRSRLLTQCREGGYRLPTKADLTKMRKFGSWPGEPRLAATARNARYSVNHLATRLIRRISKTTEGLKEEIFEGDS